MPLLDFKPLIIAFVLIIALTPHMDGVFQAHR